MAPGTDRKLLVAARDLMAALDELGLRPVIIGGVAVSLLTRSRHTNDVYIQILFDASYSQHLIDAFSVRGLHPRFAGMAGLARRRA